MPRQRRRAAPCGATPPRPWCGREGTQRDTPWCKAATRVHRRNREGVPMTAIATEERAIVSAERPRPRVLLAHRLKPQRDRAVIRALLRGLGIACGDAEVIAPVEAPMDVRFRQAQFHVRELGDPPGGCAWHAEDSW